MQVSSGFRPTREQRDRKSPSEGQRQEQSGREGTRSGLETVAVNSECRCPLRTTSGSGP